MLGYIFLIGHMAIQSTGNTVALYMTHTIIIVVLSRIGTLVFLSGDTAHVGSAIHLAHIVAITNISAILTRNTTRIVSTRHLSCIEAVQNICTVVKANQTTCVITNMAGYTTEVKRTHHISSR